MKRSALLFGALMLGAASAANAQGLTMQMSNGWNFSFAGNVTYPSAGDLTVLAVVKPSAVLDKGSFGRVALARTISTDDASTEGWHYSYRGYALLSEYRAIDRTSPVSERKYAARLEATLATGTGFEVAEPSARPRKTPCFLGWHMP